MSKQPSGAPAFAAATHREIPMHLRFSAVLGIAWAISSPALGESMPLLHDLSESGDGLVFAHESAEHVRILIPDDPWRDPPALEVLGEPGQHIRLSFPDLDASWRARAWTAVGQRRVLAAAEREGIWSVELDLRRAREIVEILPPERQSRGDEATDYTHTSFETYMAALPADPRLHVEVLGESVEGRSIYKIVFDDTAALMPARFKPTVVVLVRQHGDEWPSSFVFEGMLDHLLGRRAEPPDSRETEQIRWVFYPMVNPDGAYHMDRYNAHGLDLNRNWSPLGPQAWQEPEIFLVQSDLETLPQPQTFRIVTDLHGWWDGVDGGYHHALGEPPADLTQAAHLETLKDVDYYTNYFPDHSAWYESAGAEGMARVELYRWKGWIGHTPEYDRGNRDEEELRDSGAAYVPALRDTDYAIDDAPRTLHIGESISFTLDEGDQNLNHQQIESMSLLMVDYSTGDRERVTIIETGANTGIFAFASPLPTAAGIAQRHDGVLQSAIGSYAIGRYVDPDLQIDRCISGTKLIP